MKEDESEEREQDEEVGEKYKMCELSMLQRKDLLQTIHHQYTGMSLLQHLLGVFPISVWGGTSTAKCKRG